jgi:NAD(P)-dependent dehydrogenase (short-subunit alcohol dehydrogenase family)
MASKVILITGASSGIGRAMASHLARQGYQVYGTSRAPNADIMDGFTLLPLDVTSDQSVHACVNEVIRRAGRLDVLINNAGLDILGALEETSLDEAKRLFETNFFGVVRMVQAVLPHMRARRSGQIINVSSGLGRVVWPFEGIYIASKHALEAYTEVLAYETQTLGIKVSMIEPGYFKTNIGAAMHITPPIPDYQPTRDRALKLMLGWLDDAPSPEMVGRVAQKIIESPSPRLRYPAGLDAAVAVRVVPLIPRPLLNKAGRWALHVDDWRRDLLRYAAWMGAALAVVRVLRRRKS